MFLPDRFIKGECPKCHAKDQYGDSCEACGATYSPDRPDQPLLRRVRRHAGAHETSEHYFFTLGECEDFLREWTNATICNPKPPTRWRNGSAAACRTGTFRATRPTSASKFPVRRASISTSGWTRRSATSPASRTCAIKPAWISTTSGTRIPQTELYHFIGKDILYFHALFWPAMLQNAGLRTPTQIFAHGFLTVNGQKMSKSRGTFITAESYLAKTSTRNSCATTTPPSSTASWTDIDLSLEDFIARVNSDLVGKYVNIASRAAGFITSASAAD